MNGPRDQGPADELGRQQLQRIDAADGSAASRLGDAGARRPVRPAALHDWLVEREDELFAIDRALGAARHGRGGVVVVEAPAGQGKSRLLAAAGDRARQLDMQVLGAQATELEQEFPYGVAVQLFEPVWVGAEPDTRIRLSAGPALAAAELLERGGPVPGASAGTEAFATVHGLTRLARNLTASDDGEGPRTLAVLVDDAQWADRASLGFLAYLGSRIFALPILLVVGVRSGEPSLDRRALVSLRDAPATVVLRPGALSAYGVAEIVHARFPGADAAFVHACLTATTGNPFLLARLLDQVRQDGLEPDATTARVLSELTPDTVRRSVLTRLDGLPAPVRAVARALSVLGDGSSLELVARLANVSSAEAAAAADRLAHLQLVHPGSPVAFVHPLIRSAIRASLPPLDRGVAHRRAATLLLEAGAADEQVATQLLHAPPAREPAAQRALVNAATRARSSGAPERSVRMLERAIAEDPDGPMGPELELDLALARAAAGLPGAVPALRAAIAGTEPGAGRVRLELALGRALVAEHDLAAAAELFAELQVPADAGPILREEADAAIIAAGRVVPGLRGRALSTGYRLLERSPVDMSNIARAALAETALHAALAAEPRPAVLELVGRSWHERTLSSAGEEPSWRPLAGALLALDAVESALDLCTAVADATPEDERPLVAPVIGSARAWGLLHQGQVSEALAEAGLAVGARTRAAEHQAHFRSTCAVLALAHLHMGELAQAELALSVLDHPAVVESQHLAQLLEIRARLRLLQLRPEDAYADALEAGRVGAEFDLRAPGMAPWRTTAALALIATGERARARTLAGEEHELAESLGVRRICIRALRCLALAERGRPSLELLRRAVALADDGPPRLEGIAARIALGAALRRSNQRVAARQPLQQALDLARAGGAARLAGEARTELGATGARFRRRLEGGLESLTPSERRVAELAAAGKTTREMAETLFVTRKTIEYHLRQIYLKLGIGSRQELAEEMARGE